MKQLKFMLAAATAFGLATASQAGVEFTDNFDTRKVDGIDTPIALTTPVADLGYTYNGTGENYSEVVAADDTHNSQMLHVDTDGTPLIRSLGDSAYNLPSYESVYIDTMVKFTATPIGDTVEATEGDKLMIYLQATNEVTIVNGEEVTNDVNRLMVKAGKIVREGLNGWNVEQSLCTVDNYTVEPNKWYRLVVTAYKGEKNQAQFKIEMCDPAVSTTLTTLTAVEQHDGVFTSLIKTTDAATISSVGFAGEGWIDDLAFGTVELVTGIDFTLTLGTGVSAVQWTINGAKKTGADKVSFDDSSTEINVSIQSVEYLAGYAGTQNWTEWTYNAAASGSIEIAAKQFADVSEGVVTPTAGTIAEVTTGSFQVPVVDDNASPEEIAAAATAKKNLAKALTWATASNKGGKSYTDAIAAIKDMNFSDEDETTTEQAYLLNCPINEEYIKDTVKPQFKFTSLTFVDGVPKYTVTDFWTDEDENTFKFNGTVEIHGATTLNNGGDWAKDKQGSFYKAVLTK